METLNNLWSVLSTPNEGLTNIIVLLASLVESFLFLLLFSTILNITSNKRQKILYVLGSFSISILSTYIIPDPFNIFINYILTFIIIFFMFKGTVIKSILAIILPTIIFALVGSLILNPYITFLNIDYNLLMCVPIYRLLYIVLTYLIISAIILLFKYINFKVIFLENLDRKNKIIIILNLIIGIITLCTQLLLNTFYINDLPIIYTFLNFILSLAYFSISLFSLTRITRLVTTTKKLQSAKEYNNTLKILHDNVRGFKHDFDNIVTTIGGYVKTNDMEGLKKYYVQLEDDCQRVNNLYVLNPSLVNNDGIYNLLTKKYYEADSRGIKVNITFLLDLGELKMKIYEFARILGILLDNSIEASSECDNKEINIIFRKDSTHSRQLIIIENTYKDKDVNIDKIFEKGISGKQEHTGLGLWEVRKIISKYNNVNLFTSKNDKLFIQQLELY